MAKYSIILPVYNGGSYVKECIDSILQQTNPEFNLHIVDSKSTDGTLEWIESLKEERIVIHKSEHSLTIEENWARIKDIPKNEFMTIIGYDDLLLPGYLEEMEGLMKRYPTASLYMAHYNYIDEAGGFVRPCLPVDEVQHAHGFLAAQMARSIDSTGTGYLMRSADYDRVGGMPVHYPNLIFADFELWTRLTQISFKATSLNNCFSYRLHQSVSRLTNGMQFQKAFTLYLQFIIQSMEENEEIRLVTQRYGKNFLLYYCESLSHRLLNTPLNDRDIKVADFIKKCEAFAATMIPGQSFKPMDTFRIKLAAKLDATAAGRGLFLFFKGMSGRH